VDTDRCARCGARVSAQAPHCPECGADPRTGEASYKRGEMDRVRLCQGVWVRAQAIVVDALIIFVAWLLVALVWYLALVGAGSFADLAKAPSSAPLWALAFVAVPLYFWLSQAIWGRTVGMRAFGLRVVTLDGRKPGAPAALVRTLLLAVDWLPALFAVGALSIWLTPRRQRLGDLAARTVVVRATLMSVDRIGAEGPRVIPWTRGAGRVAEPGAG
jgi:uncharacterized RDD family membrane protein YckC